MKRAYQVAWVVCLVSWMGVLANYEFHFSFRGCAERQFLESALCELLRPVIDPIFAVALTLLPLLTLVFVLRMTMMHRGFWFEALFAVGSWLLLAASLTHISSS